MSAACARRNGDPKVNDCILVDTDILIELSRGNQKVARQIADWEKNVLVSVSDITWMEMMVGARNKQDLHAIEHCLRRFYRLPVTETISAKAVDLVRQYRLSHGLLIADALIAATALTWHARLATNNRRDFQYVEGLILVGADS